MAFSKDTEPENVGQMISNQKLQKRVRLWNNYLDRTFTLCLTKCIAPLWVFNFFLWKLRQGYPTCRFLGGLELICGDAQLVSGIFQGINTWRLLFIPEYHALGLCVQVNKGIYPMAVKLLIDFYGFHNLRSFLLFHRMFLFLY